MTFVNKARTHLGEGRARGVCGARCGGGPKDPNQDRALCDALKI